MRVRNAPRFLLSVAGYFVFIGIVVGGGILGAQALLRTVPQPEFLQRETAGVKAIRPPHEAVRIARVRSLPESLGAPRLAAPTLPRLRRPSHPLAARFGRLRKPKAHPKVLLAKSLAKRLTLTRGHPLGAFAEPAWAAPSRHCV